ncbi:MAG: hypothetical protein JOY54_18760 [Acidobacteriaceae bacterium]|nr:hypothetical protein [Acidobacteriaceae bacterium]
MSAAVCPAPVPTPLRDEGMRFWKQLLEECKKQIDAINRTLSAHGRSQAEHVECRAGEELDLIRSVYPSTRGKISIAFEHWGPVIRICITGQQRPNFGFHKEELEMPVATDGDGSIVAVFDEGRSLCPRELACFLTQRFRRCFPGITLPCPDAPHS